MASAEESPRAAGPIPGPIAAATTQNVLVVEAHWRSSPRFCDAVKTFMYQELLPIFKQTPSEHVPALSWELSADDGGPVFDYVRGKLEARARAHRNGRTKHGSGEDHGVGGPHSDRSGGLLGSGEDDLKMLDEDALQLGEVDLVEGGRAPPYFRKCNDTTRGYVYEFSKFSGVPHQFVQIDPLRVFGAGSAKADQDPWHVLKNENFELPIDMLERHIGRFLTRLTAGR